MKDYYLRLTDLEINGLKNVKNGKLNFVNKRKAFKASVLGLYGQNGTGKTALIDALHILKLLLSGKSIPDEYCNYINVDSREANLSYRFRIYVSETENYDVDYEVCLTVDEQREESFSTSVVAEEVLPYLSEREGNLWNSLGKKKRRLEIKSEKLSYAYTDGKKRIKKHTFLQSTRTELIAPKKYYALLFGRKKETAERLKLISLIAKQKSQSLFFSDDFFEEALLQALKKDNKEQKFCIELLFKLLNYGRTELFVLGASSTGKINLGELPIRYNASEKQEHGITGEYFLSLDEATELPEELFPEAKRLIQNINGVLEQIIPGLTISVADLGAVMLMENGEGKKGRRIQLMSNKNSKEIPLRYESEGIKKIVSVLHLLIGMYNQSSITVAIDELDAGIFEYLLGEILHILSEKGKGQLIFTSHNLRPLETIDRGFIAFTTTNPENRYIRFANLKTTNNLRDFYFRDIVLGEQNEPVYEMTNNAEIALALREAGE